MPKFLIVADPHGSDGAVWTSYEMNSGSDKVYAISECCRRGAQRAQTEQAVPKYLVIVPVYRTMR